MQQSILIIGAGAVGQVYAWHFAQAGHDVHLFLKAKHVAEAERGFTLYDLNRDRKRRNPVLFNQFTCHSDWSAVAARRWDQVWLCMSSAALAQTDLQPLVQAIGDATVMVLQPGPDDIRRVQQAVGEERVVSGMITMMSYHAPLAGETVPTPGIAFWIPPLTPMAVDGRRGRADAVIATLKHSGIRAAYRPGFNDQGMHATGFLMVFLAALELSGWKFRAMERARLQTMKAAQAEVRAALAGRYGVKGPWLLSCVPAALIPPAMTLSRHLTPVDIEVFLEAHFSKVRPQTLALLDLYAAHAAELGLPHEALDRLRGELAAVGHGPD